MLYRDSAFLQIIVGYYKIVAIIPCVISVLTGGFLFIFRFHYLFLESVYK